MSLFRKPSELQAKPGIVALIYGQPGSGKSTLACSAPSAVLIDTDGGVNRINGAHQVPTLQVTKWEEVAEALREVKETPEIQTVVIDTVGKMLNFMEEHIKRTAEGHKIEINKDGSLSLKGYGKRKQMFSEFIKSFSTLGKNIIFVAHDKEEKRGNEIILRPEVGGSSTNDLMKELDLVGYMEMAGNNRTISFTPSERFYAKNTANMPGVINIPVLIDNEGNITGNNDFFCKVIDNYRAQIARNVENNRKLEDLRELIEANAASVTDAATANGFLEWVGGVEHIYNSKAIAAKAIAARAKELGLTFDKTTKAYK